MPKGNPIIIEVGRKYGHLTALGVTYQTGDRMWLCRCDCGKTYPVEAFYLKNGITKSCGCWRSVTHGFARPSAGMRREYRIWDAMKQRCLNPNSTHYARYGGRGITICEQWKLSFITFLTDMGDRPPGGEIDRIDNDGNYEPSNCRWATRKQQCRNRENSRRITFHGETKCLSEWAEELQIPLARIWARIKLGWPENVALEAPRGFRWKEYKGER